MKTIFLSLLLLIHICFAVSGQPASRSQRVFIITIDGFRWQEVYNGADPLLITNRKYVKDTSLAKQLYWDDNIESRRRKLLPFFWNVIVNNGQLYGNRGLNNKVNVKNFYKISFPGYNEMFTGHTNFFVSPDISFYNPNVNVLEYLNNTPEYHGKVVVFSSWKLFPYILNEPRSRLPINSGYQQQTDNQESNIQVIDSVEENISPKTSTRYDLLTYLNARQYIAKHHPSVVYIGLGETDEFAHAGRYDLYLQHAANIDRMIAELWYYVQTDPYYKDNTTFLITTDHGRGENPSSWTTHGFWARGSGEIWLAVLGPGIAAMGEVKTDQQLYQRQLASTIAMLLGQKFETVKVSKPIALPSATNTEFVNHVLVVSK